MKLVITSHCLCEGRRFKSDKGGLVILLMNVMLPPEVKQVVFNIIIWVINSVGRVLPLQGRSHQFKSDMIHLIMLDILGGYLDLRYGQNATRRTKGRVHKGWIGNTTEGK